MRLKHRTEKIPACVIRHRAQNVTMWAMENDETAQCSQEKNLRFCKEPHNNVTGREFPRRPSECVYVQRETPKTGW